MASHEFHFSLALSDEPHYEAMLADVVKAVLGHVGLPPDSIAELAGAIRKVLANGAARGNASCRIAFQAEARELRIGIAYDGAEEWRTMRPLP